MSNTLLQVGAFKLALSIVLAAVAWVVHRRTNNPRIAHALWLGVLVTMLVPAIVRIEVLDPTRLDRVQIAAMGAAMAVEEVPAVGRTLGTILVQGTPLAQDAPSSSIGTHVALLWLVGSSVVLLVSGARAFRFHRILGTTSKVAEGLRAEAVALSATMGLRRVPGVRVMPGRISPLVWWQRGRPTVFMSEALIESLDREQVRWILAHELAHIKRNDHVVRLVEWAAGVMFWWNPIVWWAKRDLRHAEEACCDAHVFSNAPDATPRAYGSALVAVAEFLAARPAIRPPSLAIAAVSGRSRSFERRIRMIMSTAPGTLSSRGGRAVAVAIGVGALSLGLVRPGTATYVGHLMTSTPVPRPGQCDDLAKEMRARIAAGTVTLEHAADELNACDRLTKRAWRVAELKRDVAIGRITEAQAEDDLRKVALISAAVANSSRGWGPGIYYAYRPDKKQIAALRAQLATQVQSGQITVAEMEKRLAVAMTPALRQPDVVMPPPPKGACDQEARNIDALVTGGYATAEQGAARLKDVCGG